MTMDTRTASSHNLGNLQAGLWSGDLSLSHLRLKPKCVDDLNRPFKLYHGTIGKVHLVVPWNSLLDEHSKVQVHLQDVHLLLVMDHFIPPEQFHQREQKRKQRQLAAYEASKYSSQSTWWQSYLSYANAYMHYANIWLLESLVYKVLSKLEVTIEGVHIRIESLPRPDQTAYAIGVAWNSFSLRIMEGHDDLDEQGPADQESIWMSKTADLSEVSVYLDHLRPFSQETLQRPLVTNPPLPLASLAHHLADLQPTSHLHIIEHLSAHLTLEAEVNTTTKSANVRTAHTWVFIQWLMLPPAIL